MAKDEMETTIWILGKDNKHLPALQYTPESNLSIFMYYLLYVVIWIYITTTYDYFSNKNNSNGAAVDVRKSLE